MTFDIWDALIVGIYIGAGIGWWFNRKPPIIKDVKIEANLVITPDVLKQLDMALVNAYLDQHGLTWQPKGAVFDPKRDVKK